MASPPRTPNAPDNTWGDLSILNIRTNGEGERFQGQSAYASIFMWGNFDSATVALRVSPDGKKWFNVAEYEKTAEAHIMGERLPMTYYKWVVLNAGPNTRVSAALVY